MDNVEITQRAFELCRAQALTDWSILIGELTGLAENRLAALGLQETMNRNDLLNAAAQGGGNTHPAVIKCVEARAKKYYDEAIRKALSSLEPQKKSKAA